MEKTRSKIIVILGTTASGKSDLAVKLARAFQGEIISADSRQVYRDLDLGSGKITLKEMKGVPHHLLDVVSPRTVFTVAKYQKLGQKKIAEILARGNVPIICGGTGFYIDSLTQSTIFPDVPPNQKIRAKLQKKTVVQLAAILKKLDQKRFKTIDRQNPVRLIRAIEIATELGKVPLLSRTKANAGSSTPNDILFIGIRPKDTETLKKRIRIRLLKRLNLGMVNEVKKLRAHGLSFKRLENLGLEYRSIARFLQKKITQPEMIAELEQDIWKYSKRQVAWFKRNKKIIWFEPTEWTMIKKVAGGFLAN